jgi:polar amino acid transport system substrate-binding protein
MPNSRFLNLILVAGLVAMPWVIPAPTAIAQLEAIQRRGKLIVAVKDNLRPLGFRGENGELQGLEIDIARRLAEELLGSPDAVELLPVSNQERLDAVLEGNADIAIARVTVTASRSRLVDLSRPYYLDGTGLVTKDASIGQLSDLGTATIAVLDNSSTIATIRYHLPSAKLVGVDSYEEARLLLEQGGATAFAADNSVLAGWVQEYPQYRQLPVRLSGEALAVVMPKGLQYVPLRQQVNDAIERWQDSGWLAERSAAWGLP